VFLSTAVSKSTIAPSKTSSAMSLLDEERVAIVIGAGPSGLATSLGLSNVCKKVCLVEKHPSFEKRGATFGMATNGQKTLDELSPGLRSYLEEIGLSGAAGGSLVFVWWEMRDAFLHHVRQRKNVEVYCGEEFTDIQQSENGVVVKFKSGLELKGDFLVGADGVHSQVRKALDLPPLLVSETTNFRGTLQVPETASPGLRALLEKGMVPLAVGQGKTIYFVLFNFHTRHPGRLAWVLATQLDVHNGKNITPFDIAREHVKDEDQLRLLEEIFTLSDEEHLKAYPKSSIVDLSDNILASFGTGWGGKGLITLVGDAAHGMRPTDGFGGSMALEDAVVLSRILEDRKDPLSVLLRRFESERLPRVKKVYDNQFERYEARMRDGRSLGPLSQDFLDWLLAGV
jgi:2-polyprenyl-6-methoxyphenol hydroxylase-like FAD-dependent oxidoreductase